MRLEEFEYLLLLRKLEGICSLAESDQLLRLRHLKDLRLFRHDARGKVDDVGTVVAILGHFLTTRDRHDRCCEAIHLDASVIDVELRVHGGSRGREDTRECVSDRGPACVTEMKRPGRIGRDEFHVDPPPTQQLHSAVLRACRHNDTGNRSLGVGGQPDIDEAGARHVGRRDPIDLGEPARNHRGDVPGGSAGRCGQCESDRGGVITVIPALWALDDHLDAGVTREGPLILEARHDATNHVSEVFRSHAGSVVPTI